MTPIHLAGTSDQITAALTKTHREIPRVLAKARRLVPQKKRQIEPFQGAALYSLALPYNRRGARILEIGTFLGYSASLLAQACPEADITTLNPKSHEAGMARNFLRSFPRVKVVEDLSWDFLDTHIRTDQAPYDLIFVDGDHAQILRDLPWFDYLNEGGLFVHHDYSPTDSERPCPPVYEALNAMSAALGRDFDALVVDDRKVGLAGFVRQAGDERWREMMP